ncbi:PaaI family thioesterase [Mesoterricola sediminis]|uniref:Phenylacetic acid degradation protein n=1 Tax=Mesoterricola sediminis TaxID=2927980 RepID=A0AA48KGN5_9BACT|nr:PaaI family thioesterase [Mesoterricola sediminis]BDU77588.1 phenylacetic acid degradation protein [Mesoterricola sediminis]
MTFFPPRPEGHDDPPWVTGFMQASPYLRLSGMRADAVGRGTIRLVLPARPEWRGSVARNRVHTGSLCVLADTACGFSVATLQDSPSPVVTLDLRMDYLRSADADLDLVCEATCHRLSRSVAFVRAEVTQPGNPDLVAYASATFMRPAAGAKRTGERPGPSPALHPLPPEVLAAAARADQPALPRGRSPYVDFLGVVQHAVPGAAPIFRLPYREDLIGNPLLAAVHGGVLGGFAETAMILHMASSDRLPQGGVPKAVDFSMDYLRQARAQDTFAQAVAVRQGNRVSLVQAVLWQDDPQRPVAVARGHCLMPQPGTRPS